MPIRTDRGRAAVYRRFWSWPLRSPRRLALTAFSAAGAGIGIAVLASLSAAPAPEPTGGTAHPIPTLIRPPVPAAGRPSAPPAPPRPAPSPSSTTVVGTPTPDKVAASPDAVQTARTFATRWVTHPPGMTGQQWAAQLAPLVVPEYLAVVESVDPENLPATAVTGDPIVTAISPAVIEVTVPTNAGGLQLVLLAQPDGIWRVRSYDRAEW